ncbi:hypothetical protein ACFL6I_06845 [candidate division KSB1 bacterium]
MADKTTQKEQQEQLVKLMKKWQKIEDESVEMSDDLMKQTKNPLVQIVLEILKNDSIMHKKVEQFIIDSITKKAVSLTPEELADIWDSIEKHDEAEREAIKLGEEALKNTKNFVHSTLLAYLLEEEKKHDRLLGQLEGFKNRIYPYM